MKHIEEIFYKHFDDTDAEDNFLELKTNTNLKDEILSSMNEASEKISLEFVNWICSNGYQTCSTDSREKGLVFANYSHSIKWQYTIRELYDKFKIDINYSKFDL